MDEFDNLSGLVAAADGGAAALDHPPGASPNAPAMPGALVVAPGPDYLAEASMCVDMFAAMVCGYAPSAEAVWTDPARARTASALAPVFAKYGIDLSALPPELTLVVVAGPLLWQSARHIGAQAAKDKREAEARRTVEGQTREVDGLAATGTAGGAIVAEASAAGQAPGPLVHPQMGLYK